MVVSLADKRGCCICVDICGRMGMDPGAVLLMNPRYHGRSLSTCQESDSRTDSWSFNPSSIRCWPSKNQRSGGGGHKHKFCIDNDPSVLELVPKRRCLCVRISLILKLCRLVTRERAAFAAKLGPCVCSALGTPLHGGFMNYRSGLQDYTSNGS